MKMLRLLSLLSLALLTPWSALAQTAQVTGIVTDTSQSRVPRAHITAVNVETGVSRSTETNEDGTFLVPLLQPGQYLLTVEADGFRSVTQDGITLEVDQVVRLDFVLEVGAVTESVQITAGAPLLQSSNASLGQVIETKQFTDMPLNDRGGLGLLALSDGVVTSRQWNPNSFSTANIFSANGSRPGQNEMLLDGAPNTLPGVWPGRGILGTPVQVDAVQEVKVQTSTFAAEYGRTSGGLINMVTRSGSNAWHGSVFHYLRNSALDANDFFNNMNDVPLDTFRRNQFGWTFSGPLTIPRLYSGRNRTFFFVNYQGTRASVQANRITTVPTEAARNGDFSGLTNLAGQPVTIYDPLTTMTVDGTPIRQPFPDNVIPPDRIDPVGRALVSFYPLPNLPGSVNNLIQSGANRQNHDLFGFRVDHSLSNRQQLFVRYNITRDDTRQPQWLDTAAQGFTGLNTDVHSVGADYTRIVTPSTVLNLRYGFTDRTHDNIDPALGFDLTTLGLPSYVNQQAQIQVFPSISAGGYVGLGNNQGVNAFSYRTHSVQGSVTQQKGAHTLKYGLDFRLQYVNQRRGIDPSGSYTFTESFTQGPNANLGGATAGDTIASMLLGTPASGAFGAAVNAISSNEYLALYFQDDWKLTARLTLNLGLRYDLELPRHEEHNRLDWFDFDAISPLNDQVSSIGTLRGGLRFAGVDGNPRRQFDTDWNNFAPRLGFAYQLTRSTVVRGGLGAFFGAGSIGAGGFNIASQAFVPSTTFVGSLDGLRPIATLQNPFPDGFSSPLGSEEGLLSTVGQSIERLYERNAPLPYNLQWSFSVQRQVSNVVVQVAYSGNRGVHLGDGAGFEINQLSPEALALGSQLQELVPNPFFGIITNPGPLRNEQVTRGQLLRPYPQFTDLTIFNPAAASSIYHGVSLKAERRFADGFGLLVSYTFSKNISDGPATVGPAYGHQNFYDRRADRSVVEEDVPHRFVASLSYELPFGRGKTIGDTWGPVADTIFGGWQINAIVLRQSGFPLFIRNSPNTSHSLGGIQRPNSMGFSAAKEGSVQSRLDSYLLADAFAAPEPFTFGDVGRTLSDVRGPRFSNLDFSVFKSFRIREALNVQFRCEVFNATNSPMFGLPNQSFGSAGFGAITSQANNPRQIQFALRIVF
ncbi:MAG: hypothetical protein GEU99_00090 [Luteitalea sp.]|nr:hypothetical protein [Luteitalea sp.]